jgi:hypothetical protein
VLVSKCIELKYGFNVFVTFTELFTRVSVQMAPRRKPLTKCRTGCVTCRTKKVKCDEQRSICGRCQRLRLQCEWAIGSTPRKKSKARVKEKTGPKKILPKLQHVKPNVTQSTAAIEEFSNATFSEPGNIFRKRANIDVGNIDSYGGTSPPDGWQNWYLELGLSSDFLRIGNFATQCFPDEPLSDKSFEGFSSLSVSPAPNIQFQNSVANRH